MPEGDTVFRAARALHAGLAGRQLRRAELRLPALAEVDLAGQTVREVRAQGKHLLMRTEGGLTLHSHLGMEGQWRLHRLGEPWGGGARYQLRAVLETASAVALGFRLRSLHLLATFEEDRVVGHLGPDLLGQDWDPERAQANLARDPEREVALALLDQRNLAGIGNLYKCELLFLRGVNPWTPVGGVGGWPELLGLARRLLRFSVDHGVQSTTGSLRRSERAWVFERPGQPCRRCGGMIRARRQGPAGQERWTYWCPSCQPEVGGYPAGGRPGRPSRLSSGPGLRADPWSRGGS